MVDVAKEMQREGLNLPLLIGGATTSRVHTAVKIEPEFNLNQVIHVLDASRSVTVVERLLGDRKDEFVQEIKQDYDKLRVHHQNSRAQKEILPISAARSKGLQLDLSQLACKPAFIGVQTIEVETKTLRAYIDWTPFFRTWELYGKYPEILSDELVGGEAKKVFDDAQRMLDTLEREEWLRNRGVFGLFPAQSTNEDDIEVLSEDGSEVIHTIHAIRQQTKKAEGVKQLALSDFIAQKGSGLNDYVGAFAVTSGIGIEPWIKQFEDDHDDYNSIMLKAIADRLAEAFAEYLHERIRKEFWGYEVDKNYTNDELINEKYQGIRPAPGYPACPDHTEKIGLFELLQVEERIGISLTDSLAMYPTASVSGWYFSHPDSKYFGVGKIGEDQLKSLSERKKIDFEVLRRWLGPNLM
jgi:5-methyltetrahydrofolate--homocysteine methyltransferase